MTITKKTFCPRIGELHQEQVSVEFLHNGNGRNRKVESGDCLFAQQCPRYEGYQLAHWTRMSWL